jgi:hypothetical protein
MITDENAFGILVAYHRVEDEEYGLEHREFVERFELFRNTVREGIRETPLGADVRAVDFGHAFYLEVAEGRHATHPLAWVRKVRERLGERSFDTAAFVTHGSRWVDDAETFLSTEHIGDCGVVTISNPSEPLRRALYAEAATHADDRDSEHDEASGLGWGPGLYLDTEAAEALAMVPKNAATVLYTRGAGFYRVGR